MCGKITETTDNHEQHHEIVYLLLHSHLKQPIKVCDASNML